MNVILGLLAAGFRLVNRRVLWHRMPFPPAVLNLASLRHDLRKRNLFGTQRPPGPDPLPGTNDLINNRSADGSHNDLTHPVGMRFGRNVPIKNHEWTRTFLKGESAGVSFPDMSEAELSELNVEELIALVTIQLSQSRHRRAPLECRDE